MAKKIEESSRKKEPKKTSKKVSTEKDNLAGSQPEVNIGLVGHVDHGKTTLTERLSGKWTDTHSEELKRGITIRLGYADTVFVKTAGGKFTTEDNAKKSAEKYGVLRKVSFIDAPGHESLMATMLAGSTIMDGALLLVSAAEDCPQPQTREHIMALQIAGITNVIVVQNKIDLVSREEALSNYDQIKEFLKDTDYKDAQVIPISARSGANIDVLIEAIQELIPSRKKDGSKEPIMLVARSFDINKPGSRIMDLTGGVLGGTLKQGVLHVGDTIEIRPGRMIEERNKKVWKPLLTEVVGLMSAGKAFDELAAGGSIGVMTMLDPSVVKSDRLAGSVAGKPGTLPDLWYDFTLKTHLLKRVVGSEEDAEVKPIMKNELLMLNVNAAATVGVVVELKKDKILCSLRKPVCAEKGARVTISRRLGTRFRLIGYGEIVE